MTPALKDAFEREMAEAKRLYRADRQDHAFKHLETAHVLGQRHVIPHIRTHWLMLEIGLRPRSAVEVFGQAVRIVLGALASTVGVVPVGSTGGTDIGMFKRLPIAVEIAHIVDER
ncbi:DUF3703 domain-containing protein [Noviherbaspirillum suwonense]|uniref:DUF3703 domain-containing protein n=1 Tax=Noviherbaspirillum suwonense TaxID=1224511 RepID=A0ABY1QWV2_9BURK|nr:DUF3703 domain-containing protein [Noviherbaspirillum suwonense]SMP81024.1 Protein of unknown function [Noviherbaspirillum suwonense]